MKNLFFSQNISLLSNILEVSNSAFIVNNNSGQVYVDVTIYPDVSPQISDNQVWITTSYSSELKSLTISFTENTAGSTRSGWVTLTHPDNGTLIASISITQFG